MPCDYLSDYRWLYGAARFGVCLFFIREEPGFDSPLTHFYLSFVPPTSNFNPGEK